METTIRPIRGNHELVAQIRTALDRTRAAETAGDDRRAASWLDEAIRQADLLQERRRRRAQLRVR